MNIHIERNYSGKPLQRIVQGRYTADVHHLFGVSDDIDAVKVYVHRPQAQAAYFLPNVILLPSGVWRFEISDGMTPDVGRTTYEVFGVVRSGSSESRRYLGSGTLEIRACSQEGTPLVPAGAPAQTVFYDVTGAAHTLTAVPDGTGGFTSIVDMEA